LKRIPLIASQCFTVNQLKLCQHWGGNAAWVEATTTKLQSICKMDRKNEKFITILFSFLAPNSSD